MADNHTPEERSYNMSRIRYKDTKSEEKVRKYLFSKGFRYRKNVQSLPGRPAIVLPKYRTVIFVHGCFWHKHDCKRFRWPSTNAEYWTKKITNNAKRDRDNIEKLQHDGWNVIVVWECELKRNVIDRTMNRVISEIARSARR